MDVSTVIVGSGCAGLACALHLQRAGYDDFLLVTEGLSLGTSPNTGSDKQTYYKLSLAGGAPDSVAAIAGDIYAYGGVDGPVAYAQAAYSPRAFFRLVELGVPFPYNELGEYVGYKTDHDPRMRATSAGPLTSQYMAQALKEAVCKGGGRVLEGYVAAQINAPQGQVRGITLIGRETGELRDIACANIVLATGGDAGLFQRSVFPESQTGGLGLAVAAGATLSNLHHWQYGIASTKFRWNLSGSYQQVLPRYFSVDAQGVERELFVGKLEPGEALCRTFLKGYQWPFDARKAQESSAIDCIVERECAKGCRVYLDYTRNPPGLEAGLRAAGEEAYAYLGRSRALGDTPIERLIAMNPQAVALYRAHGIDLAREPLEIAVCAQHQNGGVYVDAHWQSDVAGLYAVGEAAGTFGAYRPGGSALNAGQAGAMRAAEHILKARREIPDRQPCQDTARRTAQWQGNRAGESHWVVRERLAVGMSACAGPLRDVPGMEALLGEVNVWLAAFDHAVHAQQSEAAAAFQTWHLLLSAQAVLQSMLAAAARQGSFGGALVLRGGQTLPEGEGLDDILCIKGGETRFRKPAPLPAPQQWFETVWREFEARRTI